MSAEQWIEKLEESNSRIFKEEVISKAYAQALLGDSDAQRFLRYAGQALSPYVTFGVKQIPVHPGGSVASAPWDQFDQLLENLADRKITGHAARDAIQACMTAFPEAAWNSLARRVLIKDLRCGTSDKTFNKILNDSEYKIAKFQAQLAQDGVGQPKKLRGRRRLEVKLDGVRVLAMLSMGPTAIHVSLVSRNGIPFDKFQVIEQELATQIGPRLFANTSMLNRNSWILDGEVMSASFQDLMKHARRKNKAAKTDDCVFHVFDIIPTDEFMAGHFNMRQAQRCKLLSKVIPASFECQHVKLMPGIEVDLDTAEGQSVMAEFMADAIANKFEGIMIKDLDAPYECNRRDFWLKIKPVITLDLAVVGYEEGTGKHAGRLGAFVFEGLDDQGHSIRVSVGSGYSDADREYFWSRREELMGFIGEIEADAVTQNQNGDYSLRFPRFLRWRGTRPGEKL